MREMEEGSMEAVIAYIEEHLEERLDLERVAAAAHYSKYHLHRMFGEEAGMTLHDYVQRRRLTEGAKLLVCSERPVMEIALACGYESQQAFTAAFKGMYKLPPAQYRAKGNFYPLQLPFVQMEKWTLQEMSSARRCVPGRKKCVPDGKTCVSGRKTCVPGRRREEAEFTKADIVLAEEGDIPAWMELMHLSIDGYPGMDEADYREKLKVCIRRKKALVIRAKEGRMLIGALAFSERPGSIVFLGVHPRYRSRGIQRLFLDALLETYLPGQEISTTTFRAGDKADTGQRAMLLELGFGERELLTEFGYPTQRLVFVPERREESRDE